jgi:hypothetical protein
MLLVPPEESWPAARMALAGAVLETVVAERMSAVLGLVGEPYRDGRAGRLMRAARALTLGGVALSALGGRSRVARRLAGASYVAGSLVTRFGVFEAGLQSARDPRYTVVPQRERMAARART